jgi:hypothetical protein
MLKRRSILILIVLAAMLISGTLKSRQDYMETLPVYKRYMCSLCHTSITPGTGDLNDFGYDFRSNKYVWDKTLAEMDSDGDDYPNGLELGDEDGDGEAETYVERSNPGDPLNNPSSIDKDTWGIIKNLFKD